MPKLYITGVNSAGRSCVVETRELALGGPPAFTYASESPVPKLVRSGANAQLLTQHGAPGSFSSAVFGWTPQMYTDPHRTISLDVDTVLEGSVILGLEEGEVVLRKGDVVVLPGTVHTWRGTEETGLVLYCVQAGAPTPEDLEAPTVETMTIVHGM